jgi:hypothetical protein
MEDLVDAVGVDAGRYSLVRSPVNSSIDIDLDLLTRRTNDNPVFYVQYAHARTRSVARNAEAAGVTRDAFDASLLSHPTESALLGVLAELPRVVTQAAELREPHRVARYIEELAGTYHRWYDSCRPRRRGGHRPAPHAPLAQRRGRPGRAQRARPARRLRSRPHVTCTARGAHPPRRAEKMSR